MKNAKINYIIDSLALVAFSVVAFSGLAIKFFMPGGVRQGRFQEFLGVQKSVWSQIHDWFGILLIVMILLHLFLHWEWIMRMTKKMFKSDAIE